MWARTLTPVEECEHFRRNSSRSSRSSSAVQERGGARTGNEGVRESVVAGKMASVPRATCDVPLCWPRAALVLLNRGEKPAVIQVARMMLGTIPGLHCLKGRENVRVLVRDVWGKQEKGQHMPFDGDFEIEVPPRAAFMGLLSYSD